MYMAYVSVCVCLCICISVMTIRCMRVCQWMCEREWVLLVWIVCIWINFNRPAFQCFSSHTQSQSSQITASKSVWFEPSVLNGVGHLNKNELTNIYIYIYIYTQINIVERKKKPYTQFILLLLFFLVFCLPSLRLFQYFFSFLFKLFICSFWK